ncbi:MAG: hypothetical protein AAB956_02525, partial [Patescibacteria group bacterium]
LSTIVVPKSLERASNNGSILVRAIDANGQPISGANVNITNTTVSPIININDITDGQGYLEVVDTPTGTLSYNISVTKSDNYSTDFTTSSSATNPNPSKLPITVESKKSATATFQIDQLGSINIHSVSKTDCSGIGGVGINARGQKLIGVLPVVYKYSRNITTDGNGDYALANMEWDSYFLTLTGSVYDIAGTIPMLPAQLLRGGTQDVSLILSNHTANSLLVKVKDAGTGLPLSGVTVRLTGVSYDNSLTTGLGYARQTDWSLGSGQASFVNEQQYFSDDGKIDGATSAGDAQLKKLGDYYFVSGALESSTFDLNNTVNFNSILFSPTTQPTEAGEIPVRIQMAAANSPTPAEWNFTGPDGTTGAFYTATNTVAFSGLSGNRYFRYKLFLSTDSTQYTPLVSEIAVTYTNSCTPPGQTF